MTREHNDWLEKNFTVGNMLTIVVILVGCVTAWANMRSDNTTTKTDTVTLKQQVAEMQQKITVLTVTTEQHTKQLDRIEQKLDSLNNDPPSFLYRNGKLRKYGSQ